MRIPRIAAIALSLGTTLSVGALAQGSPKAATPAPANSGKDSYAECLLLWEPATHMTKQDWAKTCERMRSRLDNLQIENSTLLEKIIKPQKSQ
jgi:hypothetical protein